ncbi:SCO family protein [Pontibacter fetidus]|uniref:SCO family protein n=1 Tax=Pontibacter fetidus TaxID=2700082 RepID=A0A6B2H826_9BACT|nr:SCO family protein [Pontibacter fetidus]NDK55324.1 SCO family protein [Pontibacter fetidus]
MNQPTNYSLKQTIVAVAFILTAALTYSCQSNPATETLPILGEREAVERQVNGKTIVDTVYHQIPDFSFVDQDSQLVTQETVAGKVYVTDFFFTTCPSICPKMKSQMLRVYEAYKDNPNVVLLSHTIDPKHDTVAVLKEYAERLNVETDKWHFVTGDRDSIYDMAMQYFVGAQEDKGVEGGFSHSGHFMLIDQNRHIRGKYEGTEQADVDRLIEDMKVLLKEQQHEKK